MPIRFSNLVLIAMPAFIAPDLAAQTVPVPTSLPAAQIHAEVDKGLAKWLAAYKDFHAHPELGLQEVRTAKILADHARKAGFEVTEKVGITGVVAMLRNGPGPTVMVRADMDALPMKEETGLPYASKATAMWNGTEVPVMHACGHDIHVSVWMAVIDILAATKSSWSGTVMMVAQPAEEGGGGASKMVADGLFTRFAKPDHVLGLHVGAAPNDSVSITKGAATSSAGGFDIIFHGKGGHGSSPHKTIDPIMMAARFVVDVQAVISREKDPDQFGVITTGSIQSGSAGNIIPDRAQLRGTIRWRDEKIGDVLINGIQRTAQSVATMSGASAPEIKIGRGGAPVINDVALADRTYSAFSQVMPKEKVVMDAPPTTGSEDYSVYQETTPSSLFFFLGGYSPSLYKNGQPIDISKTPFNHSPFFAPDPQPTITTGATAMAAAVLNLLDRPAGQ